MSVHYAAPDRTPRRCVGVLMTMAAGVAALFAPGLLPGSLRLVYNASDSAPRGWYAVTGSTLNVGDLIVTRLPAQAVELAATRGYLPAKVPLLKRVGAAYGEHVCVRGEVVRINGRVMATVLTHDSAGRTLTAWPDCRLLAENELFLLAIGHAASFDSRYFGPIPRAAAYGRATPLWVWQAP